MAFGSRPDSRSNVARVVLRFVLISLVALRAALPPEALAQQAGYTLAEAVALAVERHPGVRAAEQAVRAAEAAVKIQRAGLSPTFPISPSVSVSGGSGSTAVGGSVSMNAS